ncbi:IS1182 family transposase [Myxococcus sp. MxC21-1]|uniref:IS1182 family transposase n=1 Tax=Myxococcus sp. MxC21-1 TaxID=3041439 RepID=UPI00292F8931|nr:IS1182 family transposase [Myxococcus sp. MxC21-1]WNZ60869.1 IS1182 family transposase [Myxococcus sp. MxC21-1]WNZ62680.1 IS1182 family transposase [Myxococcus sp. MxC21-1]WNZ63849.1 IS1182 family transposase [Myxococcus sp. MxC21-1]WNZ65472.1 IS1182 family transposase [Myxococcus sp. MxC21-1]
MERWKPAVEQSAREQRLLRLAGKSRKLFVFLREHRHELFDEAFQDELEAMYRQTGQGQEPQPPAMMCMALLVQAYTQASDAEAVCLSGTDSRWRMVLDRLGADEDEPAFSQGGLQQFRERLIATEMDRRLLERTVEVAKRTKGFDPKKTPKTLRVGVDSRPLEGAGRVEDTINLLGHAGRKVAESMALVLGTDVEEVCQQAAAPLLMASSIKAGLDIDWSAPDAKVDALNRLCRQLDRLMAWVARQSKSCAAAPLTRYIEALAQVKAQDLEPRPEGGVRIRQGVAADRRISIEDPDMRHGRKSKSKRFNGYKQHIGTDLDTELVVACAVTPANRPEEEATGALQEDMAHQELFPDVLLIDRAYLNSSMTEDVLTSGGDVVCRPWRGVSAKPGLFGKRDFKVNIRDGTLTCPAGEVEPFEPGAVVQFDPEACGPCKLRASCTQAASGRGRSVTMGDDERLQKRLRSRLQSRAGRAQLRERVGVEHRLAHLANRQGPKARYRGTRRNLFDLRRLAAVQNLEVAARYLRAA